MLPRRLDAAVLRHKHFKRSGEFDLVFRCPTCGKTKLYVNPHKSKWICFRCSKGGTLIGDLSFLRRKVNARASQENSQVVEDPFELPPFKPLSAEAKDYLLGRGITDESISKFGIVEGIRGSAMGPWGDYWAGRIIFPIFQEGVPVFAVGRTYKRRDRRPRYLYPRGGRKSHYLYKNFGGPTARAIITEGAIDLIKADQAGYPALALLGKSLSREQRQAILEVVTSGVIIAMDADAWSAAIAIRDSLAPYLDIRTILLERGDLGDMTKEELNAAVE